MRQKPFPPAHGRGNLCGKSWQQCRTATPRTHRKYAQSARANRTLTLLADIYVDRPLSVSRTQPISVCAVTPRAQPQSHLVAENAARRLPEQEASIPPPTPCFTLTTPLP